MRFVIGRKGPLQPIHLRYYKTGHYSDSDLIGMGEPFFISGELEGIPCIKALGVNTYWEKMLGNFMIFGVGIDPKDLDELAYVLESRRHGEIFGRWHSKYCVQGESGFMNFSIVKRISLNDYMKRLKEISNEQSKKRHC